MCTLFLCNVCLCILRLCVVLYSLEADTICPRMNTYCPTKTCKRYISSPSVFTSKPQAFVMSRFISECDNHFQVTKLTPFNPFSLSCTLLVSLLTPVPNISFVTLFTPVMLHLVSILVFLLTLIFNANFNFYIRIWCSPSWYISCYSCI